MRGSGFIARVADPLGVAQGVPDFLYADDVLLEAKDWRAVLMEWWKALHAGGKLILWVSDCHHRFIEENFARVTLADFSDLFEGVDGWQIHEADLIDGHIFFVIEKRADARRLKTPWLKQPKHLMIFRTGAYGDALMASSILPALKDEGWAISFLTNALGHHVLRENPFIDELILLGDGQISEDEKPYYLEAWAARFDRFISLTHSIEGELLKHPARADYFWADAQRRALCNRSYLAQIHALAEARGPYRVAFYADENEAGWATHFRQRVGPFLLFCMRGSALHKWWPYAHEAVCQILARTDLHVVLAGDREALPQAEAVKDAVKKYHGDLDRVTFCVATHTLREVMALAQKASVVVGPETGIMHAVSLLPVPKVLMLSHSSRRNIADDWIATEALEPCVNCYPCHRLHFGHEWCAQDERTGAACCAASIRCEQVVGAVLRAAESEKRKKLRSA
jgi:ADP-heptose:LPS heptosyltransferase